MKLRDISKIIYVEGTASENTLITVVPHGTGVVAYKGQAKDLQFAKEINNVKDILEWSVLSIVPDESYRNELPSSMPLYNYPILITVY